MKVFRTGRDLRKGTQEGVSRKVRKGIHDRDERNGRQGWEEKYLLRQNSFPLLFSCERKERREKRARRMEIGGKEGEEGEATTSN